jgi:DNA-binding response OmpR family regulator
MSTRVLVVDDELDTLNLLRTILEISGYVPITTLNSAIAVGLAEVEKPDVVLLDIMMPRLDGFTLCKMMRAHSATKDLPIIFVTAYESLDIEERRIEAGANRVINKPINMDVLIKAIDEVLKASVAGPAATPAPVTAAAAAESPAALETAVQPKESSAANTQEAGAATAPEENPAKTQEAGAAKSQPETPAKTEETSVAKAQAETPAKTQEAAPLQPPAQPNPPKNDSGKDKS